MSREEVVACAEIFAVSDPRGKANNVTPAMIQRFLISQCQKGDNSERVEAVEEVPELFAFFGKLVRESKNIPLDTNRGLGSDGRDGDYHPVLDQEHPEADKMFQLLVAPLFAQ